MKLDQVPAWATMAIRHKTQWIESGGGPDAPPLIVPEWAGDPVALFMIQGDNELVLRVIRTVFNSFNPDAMIQIRDARGATRDRDDPKTEELLHSIRTGATSLEKMAAEGGVERGQVQEIMMAIRREASGAERAFSLPYSWLGPRSLAWPEADIHEIHNGFGLQYRMMREGMRRSRASATVRELGEQWFPDKSAHEIRSLMARQAMLMLNDMSDVIVIPIQPEFADLMEKFHPGRKL